MLAFVFGMFCGATIGTLIIGLIIIAAEDREREDGKNGDNI